MRVLRWATLVALPAILLVGCGDGGTTDDGKNGAERPKSPQKPPVEMTITSNGYPGPENVAILMAEERGYFAEAGLKVSIRTPVIPPRPLTYLSEEVIDLAVSHEPQVALTKKKGAQIVTVASLIPEPTAAMIWLEKSQIDEISDLKGKTIGYPGLPFQEDFLRRILARAGLTFADVKVKNVSFELVSGLVSGRVDAIFGGTWNVEGVELESRGLDPVITRVEDLGIPPYEELVVATRQNRLAEDPESIREFVAAVTRGAAAAVEDPEAATKAILEGSGEEDPEINPKKKAVRKEAEAELEATLPLLSQGDSVDLYWKPRS